MNRAIALTLTLVVAGCENPQDGADQHAALNAPPVDHALAVTADTVAGWPHREAVEVDLDGDGELERLVVASDVTLTSGGEPLWEDGHRWGVVVEQSGRRTLLYSAFLPHSVAEVGVTGADSEDRRQVLILEKGPQHSRALVVAYDSVGGARLVSSANYPLERWLRSLVSKSVQ